MRSPALEPQTYFDVRLLTSSVVVSNWAASRNRDATPQDETKSGMKAAALDGKTMSTRVQALAARSIFPHDTMASIIPFFRLDH